MNSLQSNGLIPFYPDAGNPLTRLDAQATQKQLEQAGQEFESLFLSMMLKEMRQIEGEEGGLFSGDGGDVYGGLFDLMMGQSLAQSSPLQIASLLGNYGSEANGEPATESAGRDDQLPALTKLNSVI